MLRMRLDVEDLGILPGVDRRDPPLCCKIVQGHLEYPLTSQHLLVCSRSGVAGKRHHALREGIKGVLKDAAIPHGLLEPRDKDDRGPDVLVN